MGPSGPIAQGEVDILLAAGDASASLGLALQAVFSALHARDEVAAGDGDSCLLARVAGGRMWQVSAAGSILEEQWRVTLDDLEQTISYCLSIVSQSSRSSYTMSQPSSPPAGTGNATEFQGEPAFDGALVEAVSTLGRLCWEARSGDRITRVASPLSRLFQRVVATNPPSPGTGLLLVPLLQFYLDHGDVVMYEPEPAMQTFFKTCLVREYSDKQVARAALRFLSENKAKLKALSAPLLPRFFPLLLKTVGWGKDPELDKAFQDLLPILLGPNSTLALFRAIVDLPTLVLALEHADRAAKDPEKMAALMEAAFMGGMGDVSSARVTPQSPIRRPEPRSAALEALFAELTQDENDGVLPKAWTSLEAAAAVRKEVRGSLSPRLAHALQLAPRLLDAYVTLVLGTADESAFTLLAALVIQSANSLFPNEAFQAKVIRVCSRFLLAAFQRHPLLLPLLKKPILQTISPPPTSPGQTELAVQLVWAVGEYHMGGPSEHAAARQVFEALELLLYESLAAANALHAEKAEKLRRTLGIDRPPMTSPRLLCVVITAVTKLANVHRELASRARVCVAKVARSRQTADAHVWRKACECLGLMQEPALCAALFSHATQAGVSRAL